MVTILFPGTIEGGNMDDKKDGSGEMGIRELLKDNDYYTEEQIGDMETTEAILNRLKPGDGFTEYGGVLIDLNVQTEKYTKEELETFKDLLAITEKAIKIDKKTVDEFFKEISRRPGYLQGLEPYPVSPLLHEHIRCLNGAGIARTVRYGKGIKHSDWTENGRYVATTETRAAKTTVIVEDIDIFIKRYDKNVKKIFVFLLQKANKSHFDEVNFTLRELVELGMYSSEKNARVGINNAMSKLMSIQISGELKKGKKTMKSNKGIMFYNLAIDNSYCTVKINQELNINVIAPFFSLFPVWAYQLSNKAFAIVEYIFYLARNNIRKIKKDGCFNINLGTINDYLQQPSPAETRKHSQYIINPILEAITEIENTQENTDYKFTPIYNHNYKNAAEFLKDGYLQIEMTDKALEYFTTRAAEQEKEYKKVAARKEKALLENEKKKAEKQPEK